MSIFKADRSRPFNNLDSLSKQKNYQTQQASRDLNYTNSDGSVSSFGQVVPPCVKSPKPKDASDDGDVRIQPAPNTAVVTEPPSYYNDCEIIRYNENISAVKPGLNAAESIRITKDTTAIREGGYLYYSDRFSPGLPANSYYPLCPQKLSTVFASSSKFYSSSYALDEISNKESQIVSVSTVAAFTSSLNTADCVCYTPDFVGNYYLDWSASEGLQLLSSDNDNVISGSFVYDTTEDYFDIKLYPKSGLSYLWIRYRIPIRYRYFYNDWVFLENLLIAGEMTETEFVRVVNCCIGDNPSALTTVSSL